MLVAIRRPRRPTAGILAIAVTLSLSVALADVAAAGASGGEPSPAQDSAAPATDGSSSAPRFDGPMELQDNFLPAQLRYQSFPESAATLRRGETSTRVIAAWTNHLAQTDTYLFDGESVTNTLRLRHAPIEGFEFGIDVPYTLRFDGTLDRFIEQVETSLDAKVPARFLLPRNRYYAFLADEQGQKPLLIEREGDGLGDISLHAKGQLLQDGPLGLDAALAFSLALPTGRRGFGGEGASPSLGLHLQRPFTSVNPFAGVAITYHSDSHAGGLRLAPYRTMTYAGAEWRPCGWLGLVAEYQIYTGLTRTNRPLNHSAHYYAGALRLYATEHVMLELGAIENLGLIENRNSSDITFSGSLGVRF